MTDEQIRQILIERKRQERALQRKEDIKENIKENIKDLAAWICWAGLGYMMFLGAYMVG